MTRLTGLDGRRDGSSSIRQPETKFACSIHCSRRGKAARRGCLRSLPEYRSHIHCSYDMPRSPFHSFLLFRSYETQKVLQVSWMEAVKKVERIIA